jgi:hypothetical protein
MASSAAAATARTAASPRPSLQRPTGAHVARAGERVDGSKTSLAAPERFDQGTDRHLAEVDEHRRDALSA